MPGMPMNQQQLQQQMQSQIQNRVGPLGGGIPQQTQPQITPAMLQQMAQQQAQMQNRVGPMQSQMPMQQNTQLQAQNTDMQQLQQMTQLQEQQLRQRMEQQRMAQPQMEQRGGGMFSGAQAPQMDQQALMRMIAQRYGMPAAQGFQNQAANPQNMQQLQQMLALRQMMQNSAK